MTLEPDARALPTAENERMFQERIRPLVLPDDLKPAEEPTFVMLGGQPGAGKTGLLTASREELKARGPRSASSATTCAASIPPTARYSAATPRTPRS